MYIKNEKKIIKFIFFTLIFIIFLIVWPYSMKNLYKDITKNIGDTEIAQGNIIKKEQTRESTFQKPITSSSWIDTTYSIITVQYAVNGKTYTIQHTNKHSWEDSVFSKNNIGDKRDVIYNIYNPSKAYLKLSAGYYISFVLWMSVGILFIVVYIFSIIFIIRDGKYD